ncbi:gamma-crystallin-1-like [Oryzias latipes]
MGKIIFYENRNFGGRTHECISDCFDLLAMFDHCHSVRVESGLFMVYDKPGFTGNQYFMRTGEYPDFTGMTGMNPCIRSCRAIPAYIGSFRMRLYEHFDMRGEMVELTEDCPNLMDRFRLFHFNSCNVIDGHWLLFEQPHYRGRHFYLKPGWYSSYNEWSAMSSRIGSIRRLSEP